MPTIGFSATLASQGVFLVCLLHYASWLKVNSRVEVMFDAKKVQDFQRNHTLIHIIDSICVCIREDSPAVGLLKMKYSRLWGKWRAVQGRGTGMDGWREGALVGRGAGVFFWGTRGWLWAERQRCLVIWPTIPFNPRTFDLPSAVICQLISPLCFSPANGFCFYQKPTWR